MWIGKKDSRQRAVPSAASPESVPEPSGMSLLYVGAFLVAPSPQVATVNKPSTRRTLKSGQKTNVFPCHSPDPENLIELREDEKLGTRDHADASLSMESRCAHELGRTTTHDDTTAARSKPVDLGYGACCPRKAFGTLTRKGTFYGL
jgi:hypothetical protein